jgi:hypothetical protein
LSDELPGNDRDEAWDIGQAIAQTGVLLILAGLLVPLCVLGYQSYFWLKFGDWLPLPVGNILFSLGVALPQSEWLGAQKIVNWLLDFPLSAVPLLLVPLGLGASSWGNSLHFQARPLKREE